MTIGLSVDRITQILLVVTNTQKMGLAQTEIPFNFGSDLDHHLDTLKNPDFPIYLLLDDVCAL